MTDHTTRRRTRRADLPAPTPRLRAVSPALPEHRPSGAVVEPVRPVVDGGRFPSKASADEPMLVVADAFTSGHDVVAAEV